MAKLNEAVGRLEGEIKSLRANITGTTTSAAALDNKLLEILSRRVHQDAVAEQTTPPKQIVDIAVPTTPEPQSNSINCDFEEYPATPTLAQIGLSGKTMALVGRGAEISSYSDSEYDTSFYQK